jgi:hypothetical protein
MTSVGTNFQYDAFVSYRRADGSKVAHWIRRELQGFRPPRKLRKRYGRRLKVFLDTAYERGTSDFYENNVRPALLASRYLIVLATPAAQRRPLGTPDWIQREVEDFSQGPNGRNVFAVRAAGPFDGPLPADLSTRFPNLEIVDLRGASRFWFLNPLKALRLGAEKLKLVAPLLGVENDEMPILRQEEERRQQSRLGTAAGMTLAVITAVSVLAIYAIQSQWRAQRALESSMFATGRMVLSVSTSLNRQGEAAQLRGEIINESCDLIDKLAAEAVTEPGISEIVTCRVERGYGREKQQELELARQEFTAAVALASAREAQEKTQSAAWALLDARGELASFLDRRGEMDAAEAEARRLLEETTRVSAADPLERSFVVAKARSLERLGYLLHKRDDKSGAANAYDEAARTYEEAVKLASSTDDEGVAANLRRAQAGALYAATAVHVDLNQPDEALSRANQIIALRLGAGLDKEVEDIIALARAYAVVSAAQAVKGDRAAARAAIAEGRLRIKSLQEREISEEIGAEAKGIEEVFTTVSQNVGG